MKKEDAVDAYFQKEFLPALRGDARPRRSPRPASAEVAALWGAKPAPSFVRFIDALGEMGKNDEPALGEFMAFASHDWLAGRSNSFDFMLTEFFRRAALLTGTVAIGCTGCGDIWLVDPTPRKSRHRVFLLDHDLATVHVIADSLEALAWLCHLTEDEDTSASQWKALAKRVRGYNDVEVPKAVALLSERDDVVDRLEAAQNLYGALWFGRTPDPISPPADAHPATLIAHTLRAFLHCDDAALNTALGKAKRHPARLLQDMAKSLGAKMKHQGLAARLESLGSVERV